MRKLLFAFIATFLFYEAAFAAENPYNVKSGIYYSQQWGVYIANVIEKDSKIFNVIIDRLANGKSSKELHNNYGIKTVSTLNKDWWEQVAYYESWIVKNGLESLKTDEKGHALNPDLISGATINVAELSQAVKNATDGKIEDSSYTLKTGTSYNDIYGLYVANVIFKDGEIIKILLDFITKDGQSSKEKYDNYGMKNISSINKDWWEQAAYFEDWILKNGVNSVKYDSQGKALNVDLISGATMLIDDMTLAVIDALKDSTTLIYSDHEPLGNMRTKFLKDVFFAAINEQSHGRIKINSHWNGEISISYDALKTVKDGSKAQIAVIVPEYFAKELPLHQIFKSFPVGPTGQEQVKFFSSIYKEVPELLQEIESQGLHVIFVSTGYPVAFFSSKLMSDLQAIKGQKWRSASFWHKDFLTNAGATPITMPWGQGVFDALNNGTLDGLMVNIDSGYDINAHKAAPNILTSQKLWLGHEYIIAMNKFAWEKLSDSDKRAIEKAAEISYSKLGEVMNNSYCRQLEILRDSGANVRILTDQEIKFWEDTTNFEVIQDKWLSEQAVKSADVLNKIRRYIKNFIK